MDPVMCEIIERDPGKCACKGGPTLSILKDVQRAYEERMELIERSGGSKKLQMQVDLLRSWVGDLVGQNSLLARTVQELEDEATTRLLAERQKHNEMVCELRAECVALRRRVARKDSDLRGLVEVLRRLREFDYCTLDGIHFFEVTESDIFGSVEWRQKKLEEGDTDTRQNMFQYSSKMKDANKTKCSKSSELKILNDTMHKEIIAKDREIMRLNKDMQQYEQAIMNLRSEMSLSACYQGPNVSKKDAEVTAGLCCAGTDVAPTCGDWEPVKDCSMMSHEETHKYQERIRNMETSLKSSGESVRALRKANAALSAETHALRRVCAALDDQCRAAAMRTHFKDDIIREMRRQLKQAKAKASKCLQAASSTPNGSREMCNIVVECSPDVSVIEPSVSSPSLCDDSLTKLNRSLLKQCVIPKDSLCSIECTKRGISLKKRCVQLQHPATFSKGQECRRDDEELYDILARSDTCGANEMETERSCEKNLQESAGTSRAASSSACSDTARAHYYHNKLLSTTQILENKEETVRVQAASLSVAEARIATLSTRCSLLRKELEHKSKELQTLKTVKTQKIDVCTSSHSQEVDNQNIISALQNNLGVIEELYRECFYESAKQESLIEMLRQCCIEVRAMDRDKADQIGSLQNVINSQRWSLDKCQDISLEVDNLKSEISNFLNSSNNDSGIWEESSVLGAGGSEGVGEELQDILHQLLRLQELLTTECFCGLAEENKQLKETNQNMETQISDQEKKICALETTLCNNSFIDQKNKEKLKAKENETQCTCDLIDENKNLNQTNKIMEVEIGDQEKKIANLEVLLLNKSSLVQEYKEDAKAMEKELQILRKSLKTEKRDACTTVNSNFSQPDCTCQMQEENKKLKLTNKNMEKQISDSQKKILDLEMMLNNKSSINQEYKKDLEAKDEELQTLRKSLKTQKIDARLSTHSIGFQASCPCELEEENKNLKQTIQEMETQISDLQKKISNLEMMLHNKCSLIGESKKEIAAKEEQFMNLKKKLSSLEEENRSRACNSCDSLTLQLQQTLVKLNDKMAELSEVRAECAAREHDARQLRADLDHAALIIKQSDTIRDEVTSLRAEADCCRQQLAESERRAHALQADMMDARAQLELVNTRYREKVSCAETLERELRQAQARGVALCEETRHTVRAVKLLASRVTQRHRLQEQKLHEKEILLEALQCRLKARQHDLEHSGSSERDNKPTCSKCVANRSTHTSLSAFPPCDRQTEQYGTSASEIASCSSAPPVPPKRLQKKKPSCQRERCGCSGRGAGAVGAVGAVEAGAVGAVEAGAVGAVEAGAVGAGRGSVHVQHPQRRDAATVTVSATSTATAGPQAATNCSCHHHRQVQHVSVTHLPTREMSPSEELYARVEHLGAALADSYRRWTTHNR